MIDDRILKLLNKGVDRKGPEECWPWIKRTVKGYGVIRRQQNLHIHYLRAHRIMWESLYGPIPRELIVMHRCNNPCCCNPAHLVLGTQKENVQYMLQCGRRPLAS